MTLSSISIKKSFLGQVKNITIGDVCHKGTFFESKINKILLMYNDRTIIGRDTTI